jgi:hypothetical protein
MSDRSEIAIYRALTLFGSVAVLVAPTPGSAQLRPSTPPPPLVEVHRLSITKPTVISFLVVPDGAVDTLPDLAVIADDWNIAMAALGDSLESRGISHAMVTDSSLRITLRGVAPITLRLGVTGTGGYVFVRPGERPCLWRGGADMDSVLSATKTFFASNMSSVARRRARSICR